MSRIPKPYSTILLRLNPIAFIIDSFRKVLIYQTHPSYLFLGIWFILGIILTSIGIAIIHRYENSYAKVI